MANEVVIDGVRYVRECSGGEIKIVVLERGFVYVGRVEDQTLPFPTVTSARCIVTWGTTKHLGELKYGPLPNTKLGDPCTIRFLQSQAIHFIEVSQDDWAKHIA